MLSTRNDIFSNSGTSSVFEKSLVKVPFRILTKDEEKLLSKNYNDIKKQVDAAFRKKT